MSQNRWVHRTVVLLLIGTAGWLIASQESVSLSPTRSEKSQKPLIYTLPQTTPGAILLNQLLDQRVDIDVKDVTFERLLKEEFQTKYKLNIAPQWGSIQVESPNIRTNTITLSLRQIPLRNLLRQVLRLAGRNEISLAYVIENDAIVIDNAEVLSGRHMTKLYDCSELLETRRIRTPRNRLRPVTELNTPGPYSHAGSDTDTESAGGLFDDDGSAEDRPLTRSEVSVHLMELIKISVANESWYPNGSGTLSMSGNTLVVTQSPENHQLVSNLLTELRRMGKHKQYYKPVLVEAWWIHGDKVPAKTLEKLKKDDPRNPITAADLEELPLFAYASGRGTNRQTIVLASGQGRLLMTDSDPVVSEFTVGTDPHMQNIFFGSQLKVTTRLEDDHENASVKVYSLVSNLKEVKSKTIKNAVPTTMPAMTTTELDAPDYTAEEFAAQSVIPLSRPVLMGGVRVLKTKDSQNPTAMPLLLFIQVTTP